MSPPSLSTKERYRESTADDDFAAEHTAAVRAASRVDAPAGAAEQSAERKPPTTWGIERWLARRVLRALGDPPLQLVLWTGEAVAVPGAPTSMQLRFRDRAAFWQVLVDPELQFGECYSDGRVEFAGDLVQFLETVHRARTLGHKSSSLLPDNLLRHLHRVRSNSLAGARENIHQHYDLGESFYRLWLDEAMVYSGAYFEMPEATLEAAQCAKLDHVCRKLWLAPGESVVEVGGGWGALALRLARKYGVRVKSFNISRRQLDYARQRARAQGLDALVEFIEDDYRNITGQFDALVSLGMLEHVGAANYRDFGRMMNRCLRPHGRGLIQTIGQNEPGKTNAWIERHIFPGGHAPTLREMMDLFEPAPFAILDVENLRLHYARTLRHWLTRFEAARDAVAALFDDRFVRMWRLYLAGSCAAFTAGALQLFQVVFARPDVNHAPQTRRHLYV